VSDTAAGGFYVEFQKFVRDERLKQGHIHGVSKSGLYWKGLPTRSLAFEIEMCAPTRNFSVVCLADMCSKNAFGATDGKL
jgi:hypothetical protein